MQAIIIREGIGIMSGFATRDGGRLLTVPEAAALWSSIADEPISETTYRRLAQSGKLELRGVILSPNGSRLLTDADSLTDYWRKRVEGVSGRLAMAIAAREHDRDELLGKG